MSTGPMGIGEGRVQQALCRPVVLLGLFISLDLFRNYSGTCTIGGTRCPAALSARATCPALH